jgi:hypothetical protein
MAPRNKVNVSTGPTIHRMSSKERHAARTAEIANEQSELKQEAAQRRANREADAATNNNAPAAPRKPARERA